MEQSLSCEANSVSATQQIFHISWNPKTNCHVRNSPPIFHIVRQLKSLHALLSHLSMTHFHIIILSMPVSSKLSLSFWFTHQNSICISLTPVRATCPVCLNPHHLIILIRFFEEFNSESSLLRIFSIFLFLAVSPDVFLGTALWNCHSPCSFLAVSPDVFLGTVLWNCHSPCSFLAVSPDVFLGTVLWNRPSPCSFLNATSGFSNPYKAGGSIAALL